MVTDDDKIFENALDDFKSKVVDKKQGDVIIDDDGMLSQETIDKAKITDDDDPFEKFKINMNGVFLARVNNAMLNATETQFLKLYGQFAEYIIPKKTRVEGGGINPLTKIEVVVKKQIDYDSEIIDELLGENND